MSSERPDTAHRPNITIRPSNIGALSLDSNALAVRQILRSVKFELLDNGTAFRLLGPDMGYHAADSHLERGAAKIAGTSGMQGLPIFRERRELFDLTFEDSWSAYFIAQHLAALPDSNEVLVIHLDDHTDMMSTLLDIQDGRLIDCGTGTRFDTFSPACWAEAICSGSISIGNYLTPFFHSGRRFHVRHLWNAPGDTGRQEVSPIKVRYPLIPSKAFAALEVAPAAVGASTGTYFASHDPGTLFSNAPATTTIVHIDLDYFINDFNGAHPGRDYVPDPCLMRRGLEKMALFFAAWERSGLVVDHWIVATSPGFCCSLHWPKLLAELGQGIMRQHLAQLTDGISHLSRGPA